MSARGLVVLTGADGFAGRALTFHLRATGVPLRGLVRTLTAATAARPDVLPIGDLTTISDAALMNALRAAETVVHLAGRAHVMRETATDPLTEFRTINVIATERVARAAAISGATHFVFASSVKVSGESTAAGAMFGEGDPPDPHDDYAASKWEAECMLADVARETGMPVTILRLPLLYGPGAKGNIGWLVDAVMHGVPLPLACIDNRRSLLGAGNFASAVDAVLGHPAPPARAATTYFVADPVPVSTPDLARAIAVAAGVTARLVPIPLPVLRLACTCVGKAAACDRLTGSLVVDSSAFCAAFGWRAPRSPADEIADMVRDRRAAWLHPL